MSELRARRFEELLDAGSVIVTVQAITTPERTPATETLEKHGADVVGAEE